MNDLKRFLSFPANTLSDAEAERRRPWQARYQAAILGDGPLTPVTVPVANYIGIAHLVRKEAGPYSREIQRRMLVIRIRAADEAAAQDALMSVIDLDGRLNTWYLGDLGARVFALDQLPLSEPAGAGAP